MSVNPNRNPPQQHNKGVLNKMSSMSVGSYLEGPTTSVVPNRDPYSYKNNVGSIKPINRWNFNDYEVRGFFASRKKSKAVRLSNQQSLKRSTIDPRTGLSYEELKKKHRSFEKALQDPNMNVIHGIISGNLAVLLENNHAITEGDAEKSRAKIYMALLGLESFLKRERSNRKQLKAYLNTIAPSLESEVVKLEELLNFLITSERKCQLIHLNLKSLP